ncbi:MAG: T9SS type A sorting domain-containing protein [Bacteroidota bacterium]|nr:T9SS type A sorting domain-containing protein [Bacteroidota bacterium]
MNGISKQIKMPGTIEGMRRVTIFTVYRNPGPDQDRPVWQINGGFGDLSLSTRQVASKSGKMSMVFEKPGETTTERKKSGAIISTYLGQQSFPPVEDATNKDIAIQFGSPAVSPQAGQSAGLVGEFIVYETILKEKQIARIESYLAIKYGITLQKNYVNSLGETIWSRKNEEVYSNNIAGIGRDDQSSLYQKQGTSSSSPDQLVIGINKIAPFNSINTGRINDRDYLVWGDNAMAFTLSQNAGQAQSDILLSEKKWLMKLSGKTAATISTELKIDTKTLLPADFPKEYFCLAIDRSGSGDFVPKNCTYITPDNISADGIASFSGLHWDMDGSGKDAFSFGLKTRLSADADRPVTFQVYPNPLTDGYYNVAVSLDKPADITVRIYDIHLHLIESKKAFGQANYLVPGTIHGAAGTYLVKLFTNDREFSQLVIKP